jgi:Tfp pilus assembly PilM family ATPase
MTQVRVMELATSIHRETLEELGFHYCKKDTRFEKNIKDYEPLVEVVRRLLPGVKVEVKI